MDPTRKDPRIFAPPRPDVVPRGLVGTQAATQPGTLTIHTAPQPVASHFATLPLTESKFESMSPGPLGEMASVPQGAGKAEGTTREARFQAMLALSSCLLELALLPDRYTSEEHQDGRAAEHSRSVAETQIANLTVVVLSMNTKLDLKVKGLNTREAADIVAKRGVALKMLVKWQDLAERDARAALEPSAYEHKGPDHEAAALADDEIVPPLYGEKLALSEALAALEPSLYEHGEGPDHEAAPLADDEIVTPLDEFKAQRKQQKKERQALKSEPLKPAERVRQAAVSDRPEATALVNLIVEHFKGRLLPTTDDDWQTIALWDGFEDLQPNAQEFAFDFGRLTADKRNASPIMTRVHDKRSAAQAPARPKKGEQKDPGPKPQQGLAKPLVAPAKPVVVHLPEAQPPEPEPAKPQELQLTPLARFQNREKDKEAKALAQFIASHPKTNDLQDIQHWVGYHKLDRNVKKLAQSYVEIPEEERKRTQVYVLVLDIRGGQTAESKSAPGPALAPSRGHDAAVMGSRAGPQKLGLTPEQTTAEIAVAKRSLISALSNGDAASVEKVMAGLQGRGLTPEQIADIVAAKDSRSNPGLYFALQRGHGDAVEKFMAGLRGLGLGPEQIADIVAAKNGRSCPGLYYALLDGHGEAVEKFMAGLHGLGLGSEQIADIVAAKDPMSSPGLYFALHRGHGDAVEKFMAGLSRLRDLGLRSEQIGEIAAAKNLSVPGLFGALKLGHSDAVEKFMAGLRGLGLRPEHMAEIVAAKNSQLSPGLFIAFQQVHGDVVKKFMAGLHGLGLRPEQIVEIVAAKNGESIPGLYVALHLGHGDAVEKFMAGLSRLRDLGVGSEQIAEIAAAKNGRSIPGLCFALRNGHGDAVEKFMAGLRGLGLTLERIAEIGAAASNPGIRAALARGHGDAVENFKAGLRALGFTSEQVAEIMRPGPSSPMNPAMAGVNDPVRPASTTLAGEDGGMIDA